MYSVIFMIDVIGTIDFSNAQTIKAYKTNLAVNDINHK